MDRIRRVQVIEPKISIDWNTARRIQRRQARRATVSDQLHIPATTVH